ncbi:MAG: TonB family protein, partial [Myxococcales bacterium]|nr:TonB family protein [Myxococcales bacterium]
IKRPTIERPASRTVDFAVALPKPPPPREPPPTAPKPLAEPKPVAPPPSPKLVKKVIKRVPKTARKRRRRRSKRRRTARKAAPKPRSAAPPAPLVLSQVYGGAGGVQVAAGDSDVFGDPALDARDARPDARPGGTGDGTPTDDDEDKPGLAEERKVTIEHARPRQTCRVKWPTDTATARRIVEVQLLLTVTTKGRVAKAKVLRSMGAVFDAAAVAALTACPFKPGTRNGRPFRDRVPFVVEFRPGSDA